MKRIISLIIAIVTVLSSIGGCTKKGIQTTKKVEDLRIICPTGAPSVAFYNYSTNDRFETNSKPANIVSFMTSSSIYDIVVIDTVSGIRAINNGAPYKIAATITFGNFYIASTGNDENGVLDSGDKIVLFGQGQTPDMIFHYLFGTAFDSSIEYVSAVSDAATVLASGRNLVSGSNIDYVFIAEPVLSATLNNKNAATYGKSGIYKSIQDMYSEKNGGISIIQASVFVRDSLDKELVDEFLTNLETDIKLGIGDPEVIVSGMNKLEADLAQSKFGIKPQLVVAPIKSNNRLGLGFQKASTIKEAIDSFIGLFGVENTSEEVYFE